MTIYVAHRQNDPNVLGKLHSKNVDAIEIDLRSDSKEIIISHDPFKKGAIFNKNIKKFKNFLLIVDIKGTGFSEKIYNILKKNKIKFIFLNLIASETDYMINKSYSNNLFLRYSSFEKPKLDNKIFKKIKWVWLDYFQKQFISVREYKYIKKYKKKICLTSPDLIFKDINQTIKYIKYLNKNNIKLDMVCTKVNNIKIWKEMYKY